MNDLRRALSRRRFLKGLAGGVAMVSSGPLFGCAPVATREFERGKDLSLKEKEDLIERYAPILWFHEDEYFLPVAVEAFFQRAKVIWRTPDGHPFKTLGSLEELNALLRDPAHRGENVFGSSLDLEPLGMGEQPWLGFKGLWGERVKKAGWSGPPGPNFLSKWDLSDLAQYNALLEQANHFTYFFQKITRFSHAIREADKGES